MGYLLIGGSNHGQTVQTDGASKFLYVAPLERLADVRAQDCLNRNPRETGVSELYRAISFQGQPMYCLAKMTDIEAYDAFLGWITPKMLDQSDAYLAAHLQALKDRLDFDTKDKISFDLHANPLNWPLNDPAQMAACIKVSDQ